MLDLRKPDKNELTIIKESINSIIRQYEQSMYWKPSKSEMLKMLEVCRHNNYMHLYADGNMIYTIEL